MTLAQKKAAYNAEVRRIKAFIRRAEKRGFRFQDIPGLDPKLARPKKADIDRLKSYTQYNLYKYASAVSSQTGKVVSGTVRRKEERAESAAKAKVTRAKKLKAQSPAKRAVNIYDVVEKNIRDLISEYPTKGASYLRRLLDSEIRKYGREAVLKSMMESPEELIGLAQDIVYYEEDSGRMNRALRAFADIIQGHLRSPEEEAELDAAMDDTWEDVQ